MDTNLNKIQQTEMQEALKRYKKDRNSAKEFYAVMQELDTWLKKKAK